MDLSSHGAACRCLLRLHENEGAPYLSDREFIARYATRFPAWLERPGEVDTDGLLTLVRAMGLADDIEVSRDYARALEAHGEGRSVLVRTEHLPLQSMADAEPHRHTALLIAMSETAFQLWCPYPNGHSDVLPEAKRVWWDNWQSVAIILRRTPAV